MSTHAARKLRTVISNTEAVLAIEVMTAAQAIEWRVTMNLDPNQHAPELLGLEEADEQARGLTPAAAPANTSDTPAQVAPAKAR